MAVPSYNDHTLLAASINIIPSPRAVLISADEYCPVEAETFDVSGARVGSHSGPAPPAVPYSVHCRCLLFFNL